LVYLLTPQYFLFIIKENIYDNKIVLTSTCSL
jgi:hypothetical protein